MFNQNYAETAPSIGPCSRDYEADVKRYNKEIEAFDNIFKAFAECPYVDVSYSTRNEFIGALTVQKSQAEAHRDSCMKALEKK